MDERFEMDMKTVDSEEKSILAMQLYLVHFLNGTSSTKKIIKNLLEQIYGCISDPAATIKCKFYNMLMLKMISEESKVAGKTLSVLNSHRLLALLGNIAQTVDPRLEVDRKGKELHPEDPKLSNSYLRIILELILVWSTKYPTFKENGDVTEFKILEDSLKKKKVVFPSELIYYVKAGKKAQQNKSSETPPSPQSNPPKPTNSEVDIKSEGQIIKKELNYLHEKILTIVNDLDAEGSPGELEEKVRKSHNFFQVELKKLEREQEAILIASERKEPDAEKNAQLYFKLYDVLLNEQNYYSEFITKNQIETYIDKFINNFDTVFNNEAPKAPTPATKTQNPIEKTLSSSIQPNKNEAAPSNKPKNSKEGSAEPVQVLAAFFNRGRSQNIGFTLIREAISREKDAVQTRRMRTNKTLIRKVENQSGNSLLKPIAAVPGYKIYEGNLVVEDLNLQDLLRTIPSQQNVHRFKMAHLCSKKVLGELSQVQIGYKSEPIYEQTEYSSLGLWLEIFVGNKTNLPLDNLVLTVSGVNSNYALFTSPMRISSNVGPGKQEKIELMIAMKSMPTEYLRLNASYKLTDSRTGTISERMSVLLPTSILKFVEYEKASRETLRQNWTNSRVKYKSDIFKSAYSVDKILSYIPQLTPVGISLERYQSQDNTEDYELSCQVVLAQSQNIVLRISYRVDSTALIQCGLIQGHDGANDIQQLVKAMQMVFSRSDAQNGN